jgi:hypothetical protein
LLSRSDRFEKSSQLAAKVLIELCQCAQVRAVSCDLGMDRDDPSGQILAALQVREGAISITVLVALAGIMFTSQALFVLGSGTITLCLPIQRRRLWMPLLAASFMLMLLLGGLWFALGEFLEVEKYISDPILTDRKFDSAWGCMGGPGERGARSALTWPSASALLIAWSIHLAHAWLHKEHSKLSI